MADVDLKFFKSLSGNVFNMTPKILDELHLALEHCENPINQTMQVISELHGPFNGTSQHLADFMSSFKGKLGKFESVLQKTASTISSRVSELREITSKLTSTVNLINQVTCSSMDTPTLRAFIGEAQKLNPLVNDMIQREIGKFPMFQQISESVGMFYNLHITKKMIDPDMVMKDNTGYKNYDTNMVTRKDGFQKVFRPVVEMIEGSHNLVDSLMHRCQPALDLFNHIPNYSKGRPQAHGYNNCQDVFHHERATNAKDGAFMKLVGKFGDQLRLLNSFFPVTVSVDYGTRSQTIETEHGSIMVDESGRGYANYHSTTPKDNLDAMGSSKAKQSIAT